MKCPECGSGEVSNLELYSQCRACHYLWTLTQQAQIERLERFKALDEKNALHDAELLLTAKETIIQQQSKIEEHKATISINRKIDEHKTLMNAEELSEAKQIIQHQNQEITRLKKSLKNTQKIVAAGQEALDVLITAVPGKAPKNLVQANGKR